MSTFDKNAGADDALVEIKIGNQVVAVVSATMISLTVATTLQVFYQRIDPNWLSLSLQVLGILLVCMFTFGAPAGYRVLDDFLPLAEDGWLARCSRWLYGKTKLALFAVSFQCIILLGYFTTFTGGAIHSPYAQSLLAIALLSPQFAKTKDVVCLILGVVLLTVLVFGEFGKAPDVVSEIPGVLYYAMSATSAIIAVVIAILLKPRQNPLVWRKELSKK